MNNLLAHINRSIKRQEEHLDIKVSINDEEIDTLFSRFSSFSLDDADIELVSSNKKIVLHYDFNTGSLTERNGGATVDVYDLFGGRHLRSLLFTAHKEAFLKTRDSNNPDFTTKLHKDYPQPVFCIDAPGGKKWFSVESIEVIRDAKIKMEGLLSIENTYAHQPIKASCEFDISRKKFSWKYKVDGKVKNETNEESYYSWYKLRINDILYCFTEWKIENSNSSEPTLVDEMLNVLKKHQFLFVSEKKTSSLQEMAGSIIDALFWNIKSISDDEIVFLACDGNTLSREISFNRNDRKIYATVPRWGKKKQEFGFAKKDGTKSRFFKMIRLIEKSNLTQEEGRH